MFVIVKGKVLVHCLMGMSRSATLVIAFLMKSRNKSVLEAFKEVYSFQANIRFKKFKFKVKLSRDVRPNDGFIKQLAELDKSIRGC